MTTGVKEVDEMREISITGNVTPHIWRKTLVNEKGRPQSLAIDILAEVVYWYRPTEIRDEKTGQVIGIKKKFADDMLQRNYKQLETMFGWSQATIRNALKFLEKKGVVERVFKDKVIDGVPMNNVMYLKLNCDVLRELTFPKEDSGPYDKELQEGVSIKTVKNEKNEGAPVKSKQEGTTNNDTTNTKSNLENIVENKSIYRGKTLTIESENHGMMDTSTVVFDAKDNMNVITNQLLGNRSIPYQWARNTEYMRSAIRILFNETMLGTSTEDEPYRNLQYQHLVQALTEMTTTEGVQSYNGAMVNNFQVIDQINKMLKSEHGLLELNALGEASMYRYALALKEKELRNPIRYLKSIIWSAFSTYKFDNEGMFRRFEREYLEKQLE